MKSHRPARGLLAAVVIAGSWAIVTSGQVPQTPSRLPLEPLGVKDEAIFPAFEGWGPLKDGTNVLLLGYYNRNTEQEFDIPIGPNNRIEPGGPDYGQPTHFYTRRQHGIFAIPVPKDFGDKRLTWTIVANGKTATVSFWMNPLYAIDFFRNSANGNEPPIIKLAPEAPTMTGPPQGIAQTLSATVNQPVTLTVWASDQASTLPDSDAVQRITNANLRPPGPPPGADSVAIIGRKVISGTGGAERAPGAAARAGEPRSGEPDITVNWRKHRGPGEVTFASQRIPLFNKGDSKLLLEAKTTATFSAPGEYVVRAQVNDVSGDGGKGEQCCWTTAHVTVVVK
jgi:hypothetical protein